jgi:voltage-gated potassium channel
MELRVLRGGRFILGVLLLLLMLFPVMEDMARPILLVAVVGGVFVAAVAAVQRGRRQVSTAAVLAVVQIGLTGAAVALNENSFAYRSTVSLGLATIAVLIIYSIYCVLHYVLEAEYISHDQIYAGICVYLMLGFAFGSIYYLLNILNPGSFAVHSVGLKDSAPDLMYFSFVTLTTLGFGDITPIARAARALVELEAVAGMLYMATFVARLVSAYKGQDSSDLEKSREAGANQSGNRGA